MRIEQDLKLDFSDVLIKPQRTTLDSRSQVDLTRTIETRHSQVKWTGVPIVAANMDGVATFDMAAALSKFDMPTALPKHLDAEELAEFYLHALSYAIPWSRLFYTVGVKHEDTVKLVDVERKVRQRFPDWSNYFPPMLCVDVANGYMEKLVRAVERWRSTCPNSIIVAGNVVTAEMTQALILAGADIVKIGIGSGSVCTTRSKTGVGYPQLSAIDQCGDAAHGLGAHIMADGGCQEVGDIAKAFGAGADFVMLGGMLAGHDECGTNEFYGMSSEAAQKKHHGGVATYRASEGKCVTLENKGSVSDTLREITGGLRSTCTYCGAKSLKQLHKRTTFVRVSRQKDE